MYERNFINVISIFSEVDEILEYHDGDPNKDHLELEHLGRVLETITKEVQGIDNHDSGYLGMAVQLYLQTHLGHYHILTQKEYSQKLMAQLKSTPHFT